MDKYHYLKEHESKARTYANHFTTVFKKAYLEKIYDLNGNEYIDCLCCAGALPLGHNHPIIIQAIKDTL